MLDNDDADVARRSVATWWRSVHGAGNIDAALTNCLLAKPNNMSTYLVSVIYFVTTVDIQS